MTEVSCTGEDLAAWEWMRRGRRLVLDRKIYAKAVDQIKDPEVRRSFDRRLAQLAADAPILCSKVKR